MAILYQAKDATLLKAYTEARAMTESLATIIPESLRENLSRPEVTIRFKYLPDGEIECIFCVVNESHGD